MEWTESAEAVLGSLLNMVPETYRSLAEGAARAEAEAIALERGEDAVSVEDAVRGWIATTPASSRDGLVAVLEQLGLDPESYADDLATPPEDDESEG